VRSLDVQSALILVSTLSIPLVYLLLTHGSILKRSHGKPILALLVLLAVASWCAALVGDMAPLRMAWAAACTVPVLQVALVEFAIRQLLLASGQEPVISYLGRGVLRDRFLSAGILVTGFGALISMALAFRNVA
jgi:hypothetical protein